MEKAIQWPGQNNTKTSTLVMVNRTGGVVSKGDVVFMDFANTQSETSPTLIGRNAVIGAAANLDGLALVAANEVPAQIGENFDAVAQGFALAKVDGGTIDVVAGDKLIATAASKNFTRSDATTDIVWARALEANAGTAALRTVYLYGCPTAPGTDET